MKKILSAFFGVLLAIFFAVVNGMAASELVPAYAGDSVISAMPLSLVVAFFLLWWFMPSKRVTLMLTTAYSFLLAIVIVLGYWANYIESYSALLWVGSLLVLAVISDILIWRIRLKTSSAKVNFTPTTS